MFHSIIEQEKRGKKKKKKSSEKKEQESAGYKQQIVHTTSYLPLKSAVMKNLHNTYGSLNLQNFPKEKYFSTCDQPFEFQ